MPPRIINNSLPTTRWTLLGQAAELGTNRGLNALEQIVTTYRPALIAHLTITKGLNGHQAEEFVQGFIAHNLFMGRLLQRVSREKGLFRNYLLTALDHYVVSQFRRDHAQRRSPGLGALTRFDTHLEHALSSPCRSVPTAFDVAWTQTIIQQTLQRVEEHCRSTQRVHYWELFVDRIVGPTLHGRPPRPYSEMVHAMGFASPIQAANALITVRRIFERTMRQVIREYVPNAKAVEKEIRDLMAGLTAA